MRRTRREFANRALEPALQCCSLMGSHNQQVASVGFQKGKQALAGVMRANSVLADVYAQLLYDIRFSRVRIQEFPIRKGRTNSREILLPRIAWRSLDMHDSNERARGDSDA